MRSISKLQAFLLTCGLLIAGIYLEPYAEENSCLICHSEIRVEYNESIHAKFDINCVDCHGGDPSRLDLLAMDLEKGFKGKVKRSEIPALCASCHSDPLRMKTYDIPTDQYAQYQTSEHGMLLASGDTEVAVCTDCHAVHKILAASEPQSTVYPENIPKTCARCHADEKLMAGYGIPTDQFAGFREGVHGIALLLEGNRKSPNCATCHGIHGATPPGVQDIAEVCGLCHIKDREYFRQSPHRRAMEEKRMSECGSCHGNHYVEKPSHDLFDVACLKCHAKDSQSFLEGQKMKTTLIRAEEAIKTAEQDIKLAESRAFDMSVYRSRLYDAHTYLIEAGPLQHTLNAQRIDDLVRRARSIGEEVSGAVHGLLASTRIRGVGLTIFWVYLLFTILVVYLYKRRIIYR